MNKLLITLFLIASVASCKKNALRSDFKCSTKAEFGELKEMQDIKKKFKVKVPKSWKTQLYYDEYKSQLFTADTTKNLTGTYLTTISYHQGELTIDDAFSKKLQETMASSEQLKEIKSNTTTLNEKPCYWALFEGEANGYKYNNLQVYIKNSVDEYSTIITKVYGNENIDQRICESLALANNLEFTK